MAYHLPVVTNSERAQERDDEIARLHTTIDELEAELEALRGAKGE